MNRREILKNLASGSVALFVVPTVLTSCEKEDPDDGNPNELEIDLTDSQYSNLATAGGSAVVNNIIVFNTGDQYIALSSICTHNGCGVSYDHSAGNLPCPCHGSVFSTAGSVLEGPADAPLKSYSVREEGDVLIIEL